MTYSKIIMTTLAAGLAVVQAQAQTIVMDDASYARLYDTNFNGSGNSTTDHTVQVGTKSVGTGYGVNGGFAFQMTGASAEDLEAADFSVSYVSKQLAPTWNVDVYATRVSSLVDFQANDYQSGTLLMEDFVTTTSEFGLKSLNTVGEAALLSYLQSNWVEDSYLFITLKADPVVSINNDENKTYTFSSAPPAWDATSSDAQLSVVVPEPGTYALLAGLTGLVFVMVRRRR